MKSDAQIVENVRRVQSYRRPVGSLLLILGLFLVVMVLYESYNQFNSIHDALQKTLSDNQPDLFIDYTDTFSQMERMHLFSLGFVLACSLSTSMICIATGLALLVGNRKDQLLLKYWDENHRVHFK
jgi:hypothetical protein